MGELPAGTVTFLFTDIEGSTRLWEEHPDAMRNVLARHDELLRNAVDANGGAMVKTTGDGIHAAFPTANDAVAAAVAMQLDLTSTSVDETGPLRVRMGAHTCEAELRDGDYYGSGVNRAARLMSVAHGGQIVVSAVTAGLCDGRFALVDLGEHRLRDLSRAERVWQVDLDGERFAALRSLDNIPGNLPVQLTEFVGRSDDVAHVADALDAHRIVTLTGVGGVGKTRLALQVAAEFADRFRHGTWFCDLTPVATPDGVVGAIADALGIDAGTVAPDQALVTWLRHHQALLVVDNCEHVLDESARIIEELVRGCAELSVLATSREGLGAPGEQILAVRSLRLPADDSPAETTVEAESVRLFLDRARAVRADLPLDDRTVVAIGEICRRLDGIPLAIELAAARMQSMSAAEVNERLDQRFRLLTRGSRVALGRHHTLQTTVDWSYQLLDEHERTALARCSVFAGGFTLSAAERVVGTGDIDPFEVLDMLGSLVRRSMLMADECDGATRYRLLETIRQFGADRLEAAGDAEPTRATHLVWCREFMAEASIGLRGPDVQAWLARLDHELDNWRSATAHAVDVCDLDAIADLFGSIPGVAMFGTSAGSAAAATATATGALAAVGEVDHAAAAALLGLTGYEQSLRADYSGGAATAQRGSLIAERHPPRIPTNPCSVVFMAAYFGQDFETALRAADEFLQHGRRTSDAYTLAEGHGLRAVALATVGRTDEAVQAAAEALARAGQVDSPLLEMQTSFSVGVARSIMGDAPERAESLLERAAALATVLGNPFVATTALGFLNSTSTDSVAAAPHLRAAMELFRTLPQREVARDQLELVASVLLRANRAAGAATLLGAMALHENNPVARALALVETQRELAAALGAERFEALQDQGRELTVDEALEFAIAELDAIIASAD